MVGAWDRLTPQNTRRGYVGLVSSHLRGRGNAFVVVPFRAMAPQLPRAPLIWGGTSPGDGVPHPAGGQPGWNGAHYALVLLRPGWLLLYGYAITRFWWGPPPGGPSSGDGAHG